MKHGRETTEEERIQIAMDCIVGGKNCGEMALKYQLSYQQVRSRTLRCEQKGETWPPKERPNPSHRTGKSQN